MRRKIILSLTTLIFSLAIIPNISQVEAEYGNPWALNATCQDLWPTYQTMAQAFVKLYEEKPSSFPNPLFWPDFRCKEYNDANGTIADCTDPGGTYATLWTPRRDPDGFVSNIYNQLNGISPRTYTLNILAEWCTEERNPPLPYCWVPPVSSAYRSGTASCQISLSCQNSCTPMENVGNCSSQCDIELSSGSNNCPQGTQETSFDLIPPSDDFDVIWGDGNQDTNVSGTVTHTFDNAGVYDIQLKQGGSTCCIRRTNATCSPEGGGLPTSTPAPTGSCGPGLECLHPCACNSESSAYIDAGCGDDGDINVGTGGGGSQGLGNSGTSANDGGSCGPGLTCCEPAEQASIDPWLKVKDASVHSTANIDDPIPADAEAYDNDDSGLCSIAEPTSLACFNGNEPGVVTVQGTITTGDGTVSFREWNREDATYNLQRTMTPSTFKTYVEARKSYNTPGSVAEIQAGTINIMNGPITLDENSLQGIGNIVLIVDGDIAVNASGTFNAAARPMMIMSTGNLNIRSTTTEMNGIFVAEDVDFAVDVSEGNTTDNPLKIKGNLISYTASDCTDKRARTDNQNQPSCFFVFDAVGQYLPITHMISVRNYQWTEQTP